MGAPSPLGMPNIELSKLVACSVAKVSALSSASLITGSVIAARWNSSLRRLCYFAAGASKPVVVAVPSCARNWRYDTSRGSLKSVGVLTSPRF